MKTQLLLLLSLLSCSLFAQKATRTPLPDQPYDKYELTSGADSVIFYLSATSVKGDLPLIVYIQGSGMSSLFADRNGRIVPTSGHFSWFNAGKERYRILIVEKPGVGYLNAGQPDAFDHKFSLESWSKTIVSAIDYVLKKGKVDQRKVLVAGHSEGGVVAARVAQLMKDKITHVAIMAGEGPSQLYSLYKFAENGTFFNTKEHNMPSPEERISYVSDTWKDILSDPNSTEKKFWGFTYLRWSSFLKTSVIEELSHFDGNILIAQGTADKAVYPESAIISYTSLRSKGKKVRLELVQNADHSFHIADQPEKDGWQAVIEKILQWLGNTPE